MLDYEYDLRALSWEDMREVRKGYFSDHAKTSLSNSMGFNVGLLIKRAQPKMQLGYGLLYLGYTFPFASDRKNANEPDLSCDE